MLPGRMEARQHVKFTDVELADSAEIAVPVKKATTCYMEKATTCYVEKATVGLHTVQVERKLCAG